MKELASRGNIESSALIQYVMDGIDDTCVNKLVLYNAKSLIEFTDKLKCYEVILGKSKSENKNQVMYSKANHTEEKVITKSKQCLTELIAMKYYNCGAKGHTSANCENKIKESVFSVTISGTSQKNAQKRVYVKKWKQPTCVRCHLLRRLCA